MALSQIPEVTKIANSIIDKINSDISAHSSKDLHLIRGAAAVGKTTALRMINTSIRKNKDQRTPILLSPPLRHEDTAQKALLELALQLKVISKEGSVFENVTNPKVTWDAKIKCVFDTLNKVHENIVLLIDEPLSWGATSERDFYGSRGIDFANFLMMKTNNVPKIVTGDVNPALRSLAHEYNLSEKTAYTDWLSDRDEWGQLITISEQMKQELSGSLSQLTPLHVRILVGLCAIRDTKFVSSNFQDLKTRTAATRILINTLKIDGQHDFLRKLIKLSLIRGPIDNKIYSSIVHGISNDNIDIMERCFLLQNENLYEMHESLKQDIASILHVDYDIYEPTLHHELGQSYTDLFKKNSDDDVIAIKSATEAFYHYKNSDKPEIPEVKEYFTDQLNLIGRSLSLKKYYEKATAVYKKSLGWNPLDDYALHYYAYNLDIQAIDSPEVESSYKMAIQLNPNVVRWHTHYINYCLAKGELLLAEQAWMKASDELLNSQQQTKEVYDLLHKEVIRSAIYLGRFDFADTILKLIPKSFYDESTRFMASLTEIINKGDAFSELLPLNLVTTADLGSKPINLDLKIEGDYNLIEWGLGRIEDVSPKEVFSKLIYFNKVSKNVKATLQEMNISLDKFLVLNTDKSINKKHIKLGGYFVIGKYLNNKKKRTSTKLLIKLYDNKAELGQLLPAPLPNPNRFLF